MRRALLVLALIAAGPVLAVQPDEILADPALEARAREISRVLRCPICQGETIDDSNAGISRDLRLYVRERLVEGDSNAEVIDAVTARYGEFVLFEPRATGSNLILYLAAPAMGLAGLGLAFAYIRSRRRMPEAEPAPPLSKEEQARLDRIMAGD
ncbi:cytochrome C biogenesis protein CcdA [Paracoccus sp. S-4012]|uniref:cytochrome c-type biogenesis protein n=1 Tax=Paracoccus sp. S-4012 TaxID=2665648 RepID=UPI0012B127E2|nr:cytochrome c-type biogenesis protein [Paracoccus sp. S-4012]MRX51269.1 cytochrome C biogenesis protein CcdA [Paracoccus sp. S-4012]